LLDHLARQAERQIGGIDQPRTKRIYEDYERRDTLLKLARFHSTASAETQRSLKDYVAGLKPNQTAIYYIAGEDQAQLESSLTSKASAPAASKFCCWPTWSTACG